MIKLRNIGYACLTLGIKEKYRTCRLKNLNYQNLFEIIEHNLKVLSKSLDYNHEKGIFLFRISSDIIPFGNRVLDIIDWPRVFNKQLDEISLKIKKYKIRVSMHPGQYTVINSPKEEVVKNSIADLKYHALFLDSLKVNCESKIILHIGGIYDDKEASLKRFVNNFNKLTEAIRKRIAIENDDKSYGITDVIFVSDQLNVPIVYDSLHHYLNNNDDKDDSYWINKVRNSWRKKDGQQKIHYSQQAENKPKGSHSETIDVITFQKFIEGIPKDIDIMLEVKDKDQSVIKILLTKI